MRVTFNFKNESYSWNSEDLQSAKQAVSVLKQNGLSDEQILALDEKNYFGNLDVLAVLEE